MSVIRCGGKCIVDLYHVTGTTRFDFEVLGIGDGGTTGKSSYSQYSDFCNSNTVQSVDAGGNSNVYVTVTHSGCYTGGSTGQWTYAVTLPWSFAAQACYDRFCTMSASTWYTLGEINYVAASYSCSN